MKFIQLSPAGNRVAIPAAAVFLTAALSLFGASSCRMSTVAPVSLSVAASDLADPSGEKASGQPRQFDGVRLTRAGDRVKIAIEFAHGNPRQLPEDAAGGAAYQLLLDTDQNDRTGGDSGEECLFYVRDGVVQARRYDDGDWTLVETGKAGQTPSRVTFDAPAALLGDDIFVNWTVEIFALGSDGWSIVGRHTGSNRPVPTPRSWVPMVQDLRAEVKGNVLQIRGRIEPRDSRTRLAYDPYNSGGWALQLFLDTDQAPTGYWLGFDYIVRGVEWNAGAGTFVTRRITLEDQYPGGWGPETGSARFAAHPRSFEIDVPLAALGDDDGTLSYALETYATVDCSACGSGSTQEYMDDYFGTADGQHGRGLALGAGRGAAGFMPLSLRPTNGRSASSDRFLARGSLRYR